jgi:hypothetical protein
MKVTGYQLREAITMWKLRKTTAEGQFTGSLARFADETTKELPHAIVASVQQAEESIVRLQVAQMRYNLAVKVAIPDAGELTLAEAIKLSGVVSRIEKIWNGAAADRNPYGYNTRVRDLNQDRAEPTVTPKEVLNETTRLTKRAGALRAAIGAGNTREVEIEDLHPTLLE